MSTVADPAFVIDDGSTSSAVWLMINLLTSITGLYIATSSIKLLFPFHTLYNQFVEIYTHLAEFWGIEGHGSAFRYFVGIGKLGCGLLAAFSCWLDTRITHVALSLSLCAIVAIMTGAFITQFNKGWVACQEAALLLGAAVVSLYLQCEYGQLKEDLGVTFVGLLGAASCVLYFYRLRITSLAKKAETKNVSVIAAGQSKPGTYYRLA